MSGYTRTHLAFGCRRTRLSAAGPIDPETGMKSGGGAGLPKTFRRGLAGFSESEVTNE